MSEKSCVNNVSFYACAHACMRNAMYAAAGVDRREAAQRINKVRGADE